MKQRLDRLLVEKNLVTSREKAKRLIQEGAVLVNGICCTKANTLIETDAEIIIGENSLKFVSRGGLKLEKALQVFHIDLNNKVCIDIGASTGGFTDCMLQNGAKRVYAVDVGKEQLVDSLREDPRVISMENTNIRYLNQEDLPEPPSFAGIDVSFISLEKVLPAATALLTEDAAIAALIKPQFEAGKNRVGKKGVVKDAAVHAQVLDSVISYALACGLYVMGLSFSPIKGPNGNIEYLIYLQKTAEPNRLSVDRVYQSIDIRSLVKEAHKSL